MDKQLNSDIIQQLESLCSQFSERAASHDQRSEFVFQNYKELKDFRFFSKGIPAQFGGGNLSYHNLCQITRRIAQACGSTALAYAMHSHPVALNVFKAQKGDPKAEKTLEKIATNELIIAGTGANDWLESNGSATAIDGGYIVNAHKRFVSGGPGAQVLVSSVNFESANGNEVLHFSLPLSTEGIQIQDNWNTLGMRATGSNDVILENLFLPDGAIVARRPAGQWHAMWDAILPNAMPLICSAYMGLADAARSLALSSSQGKDSLANLVGEMNNHFTAAELALKDMIERHAEYQFTPSQSNTEAVLTRKTLVHQGVRSCIDIASTLVGGSGFFKGHPLERIIRDARAMHFHPLPNHKQTVFSGRFLLGLDPVCELIK
jgi:alkylation response protein AidB-like acyl-CoA dehydrogenase